MTYNVRWLLDEMARILDFDSTATDQDYHGGSSDAWWTLKQGLNRAYTKMTQEAKLEVPQDYFKGVYRLTWPANEVTFALPEQLYNSALLSVFDVTSSEYGQELIIYERQRGGCLFWDDYRTLRWDVSGPGSAKSLKFEYLMDAEELSDDAQVPLLIPFRHRFALLWSAVVECRTEVDEDTVPTSWFIRAQKQTQDMIIDLSKGRLRSGNRSRMYIDYE